MIVNGKPFLEFSEEEIEKLKIDIKDNFPDLTDEDRQQILDWVSSRFHYPTK